uniref:Uncharacterized protein n=1 Tax=Solanum lycopersicum TaxID=4081 RepID=A0A3Q7GP94_SOLLC
MACFTCGGFDSTRKVKLSFQSIRLGCLGHDMLLGQSNVLPQGRVRFIIGAQKKLELDGVLNEALFKRYEGCDYAEQVMHLNLMSKF